MIPQDVPAVVAQLQDNLTTERYMLYLGGFLDTKSGKSKAKPNDLIPNTLLESGAQFGRELANLLNVSTLFHVTEPMMAVARHVAEKVEPDLNWMPDDFPSLQGFMVYEQPLALRDHWNRMVTIAAMQWYTSMDAQGRPGMSTILYADREDVRDYYNHALALEIGPEANTFGRWQVFESRFMPWGQPVGYWMANNPHPAELGEEPWHEMAVEDQWRMAVAAEVDALVTGAPAAINLGLINHTIFWLMTQTVASTSQLTDRKLARRYQHKRHKPPPMVTVISLRREADFGYRETEGELKGQWLTYRSITRGHPRRQHYKDPETGEDKVKRIWINPYWRGPENAPVYQPHRVNTLKR